MHETETNYKPTLLLDFDGVIHRYSEGWKGIDVIYDPVTDGFFEWLIEALEYFSVVIYSSRSSSQLGIEAMTTYLYKEWFDWVDKNPEKFQQSGKRADGDDTVGELAMASEKPAAYLTIDDRCKRFEGDWDMMQPKALLRFKPWTAKSFGKETLTDNPKTMDTPLGKKLHYDERKAPEGKYRIIGVDTFDHTDWKEGDFDDLESAKEYAKRKSAGQQMLKFHIYDDRGNHMTDAGKF